MLFPVELSYYNLTTDIIRDRLLDHKTYGWSLHGIPNVEFYRKLHCFLKNWSITRSLTKTSIGKFYLEIDKCLQERGSNPCNTYRFIESIASSNIPDSELMSYGTEKSLQAEMKDCYERVEDLDVEMKQLKFEFERTKEDLILTRNGLSDMKAEKIALERERGSLQKKLCKAQDACESTLTDLLYLEDDLLEKNSELLEIITSLEKETATCNELIFETKCGRKLYSNQIRQLYYSLLADQVPPSKIPTTIKSVLKCFFPSLDTDNIALPQERCAGYMRKEELKTISMAHKAYTVIDSEALNLNSDGTTKFQKKIGGAAVNGMVLSLNEVPDGSANSMIEDISRELEKLRDIAHALNLHDPERINWTLFTSSTSDSASTQKRFNRLLEQRREEDEEKFGPRNSDAMELVENLCAMHLGSNLRKAFLDGTRAMATTDCEELSASAQYREHDHTDTLIHEFCKLFGTCGVPEYGCGISFADYLALKTGEDDQFEESTYYHSCSGVVLERQVGSRYFVSACNATKIFFLSKAAKEFLNYTGKDKGNKLEQTLYRKLQDPTELARLKADALMFYFVYSELVMLAKSEKLGKSALDMNQHYLELQLFLQKIEDDPEAAMNKDHRVFVSEERLYGYNKDINHRIRAKHLNTYARLFQPDEWDGSLLYPLLQVGAKAMNNKLSHYARNQLPGGKYWDPEPAIKVVLRGLKPNNDICESIIIGLK